MAVVTSEATIELLYRPAAGGAGTHAFIVYTDEDGVQYYTDGIVHGNISISATIGHDELRRHK